MPVPDEAPAPRPWRLFFQLLRPYRWQMGVGFFLLILTNVFTMLVPRLVGLCVDGLEKVPLRETLFWVGAIVVVALVRFGVRVGSRMLSLESSRKISYDLREQLFGKFLRLPLAFFQKHSSGDLISRAINDVSLVRGMSGFGLMFGLSSMLSILLAVLFMMTLDWRLSLLVLVPIPPSALIVTYLANRIKFYTIRGQKTLGRVTEQIREDVSGVQVVKGFNLEDFEEERFEQACQEYMYDSLGQARMRALMQPLMMLTGGVSALIVLYYGGMRVIEGQMSLGDFTAFNLYLGFLLFPTVAIGWTLSLKQRAEAALLRLTVILDADETIHDAATATPCQLQGALEVRALSFRYPGDDQRRYALDKVSLRADPGECIALVGKVGSGKTTLIRCLLRLLDVPPGSVLFDGIDIVELRLADLRRDVSYVPQDDFLFSTSVWRNVGLGKQRVPLERVRAAADRAEVDADVQAFPDGYHTRVGERGLTVSGGQRQRIGLARALLRGTPLLLLDDCLSAIDAETAANILSGLRSDAGRATCVIAAHRLQSVRHADRIYVFEKGAVTEVGSHEELLAGNGLYARMWEQQQLALEMEAG